MEVRVLTEEQITDELDIALKRNLCACFQKSAEIYATTRGWPGAVPYLNIVLQDGDKPFGYLVIVERTVTVGDQQIYAAGVANVSILPEYRKQGYCDILLSTAMEEAGKHDFDCGILFTSEPIKKVYARNGWIEIRNRKFIRTVDGQTIIMPEESVKMFYPLKIAEFPAGDVDLCGNDW